MALEEVTFPGKEFLNLKTFKHPNIVQFFGITQSPDQKYSPVTQPSPRNPTNVFAAQTLKPEKQAQSQNVPTH